MSHLFAIIMAGGAGTRFWPASRNDRPKQLLPLAGKGNEPLVAASVRRILPICSVERVIVVTGGHLLPAMRAALPELPAENFLSEPVPRNTAPCIGWAAATVERFIEKPELARAEVFATSGRHLWNSGMFFFRAGEMTDLISKHMPELARGLERIDRAAALGDEAAEIENVFPTLPAISIDHGVMEKAERVAVVDGNFGWSDVGSWQSSWELAEKDANGNAAPRARCSSRRAATWFAIFAP